MGEDSEEPALPLMATMKAREVINDADEQRDKYNVVREIGKGTFGIAYLVKNKARTRPTRHNHRPMSLSSTAIWARVRNGPSLLAYLITPSPPPSNNTTHNETKHRWRRSCT